MNPNLPAEYQPQLPHPSTDTPTNAGVVVAAAVSMETVERHIAMIPIGTHTARQLIEIGEGVQGSIAKLTSGASILTMQSVLEVIGRLCDIVVDIQGTATNEEKIKAAKVIGDLQRGIRDMNTTLNAPRAPTVPQSNMTVNVLNAPPRVESFAPGEALEPIES